jgi:DNA-binding PadR family transcriptional regulator
MNKETVAIWLGEHGPCTSADLRRAVGLITKGTPIASRLTALVEKGMVKTELNKSSIKKIYTLNAKGKKWIKTPQVIHLVESIDKINTTNYSARTSQKRNPATLNLDPAAEKAMNSIVELLERNKKAEALIRVLLLQCQTFLDKGESDEPV